LLPCSWTTLYKLAKLQPHEFERVTRDERFGPMMTAREVGQILSRDHRNGAGIRAAKKNAERRRCIICFDDSLRFGRVSYAGGVLAYIHLQTMRRNRAVR